MRIILLCGDSEERSTGEAMAGALAQFGGVIHCRNGYVGRLPKEMEKSAFFLLESETIPQLCLPDGIMVFKNQMKKYSGLHIPNGFISIVDSSNAPALSLLQQCGTHTVTCGMSASDTLSISSRDGDVCSVSLQRTVALSAQKIESQEVNIKTAGELAPFSVLAICGVLLLSGCDLSRQVVLH